MSQTTLPARRESASAAPAFGWVDLAVIVLVVIWGTNFVVVKAAVAQMRPLAFTALRFTLAALVLLSLVALNRLSLRRARADLWRLALLGLVGNMLYQPLFILGLTRTTAGNSSIILAAAPMIVAVEAHFLGTERLRPRAWLGVLLAFGGLALVIVGGGRRLSLSSTTLAGDLLTLGAAFLWATYTVMSRPLVVRLPPLVVTTVSLLFSLPALLLLAAPSFAAQDWGAVTFPGWGGLAYSGLLAIGLGYAIWGKGVQRLGGPRTSVYANLAPVVAALTGVIFLGDHIGLLQAAGMACVLGGVVLTRLRG